MANVVERDEQLSEDFFKENVMDRRNITKDWILVNSPVPVAAVLLTYGLVLVLGRRWMAQRPSYQLKNIMRLYNLIQIFHNIHILYSFMEYPQWFIYAITKVCTPPDISTKDFEAVSNAYLYYSWNYLISKMLDLFDTLFMILRKKNSQITFLHVYHHSVMVFFTWLTLAYTKSQHAVIPGFINVVVHTVMYSYYFFSTFNRFKKYLWWKRHLTKLQLGQFVIILSYIMFLYYNECPMSRMFTICCTVNTLFVLVLFINFYTKAYMLTHKDKST